jgi:MFS family permease
VIDPRHLLGGPFARAMVTSFLFFGSLNGFVLLPIYIHRLGGTEAEIGLVQAMYSATGIICQPVVGLWVDRLGRRLFMVWGAAILTGASALFVLTDSLPLLALLRALHGIAFSTFFVANYIHVVELVPVDRRGWALGIYGLSGLMSTALAPLIAEFIIRRLTFAWSFFFSALLGAGALTILLRSRDARPPAPGAGPGREAIRLMLAELRRRHNALGFFFGLGTGTVFTFLPTFAELLGVRGLGLFYTAYATAAMIVRLVGGTLIDTRGRKAVIVPSMFVQASTTVILAVMAALVGPFLAVPVLPFLFLAGFLAGGAHGFLYPALSALLMDVTPDARRGSAVGVFSSVVLVGNAVGAVAFGYVAHGLGYAVMWTVLAQVMAIGFLLSLKLRPAPPRRIVALPAAAVTREASAS